MINQRANGHCSAFEGENAEFRAVFNDCSFHGSEHQAAQQRDKVVNGTVCSQARLTAIKLLQPAFELHQRVCFVKRS